VSNHYYLSCVAHEEVSDEVGNRNALPASVAVENRENIVKAVELLKPLDLDASDFANAHWSSDYANAIRFVARHYECELELHDESGALVPFVGKPDPHEGEDKFCQKCGSRISTTGIPVGRGHLEWLDPRCPNEPYDKAKIAFVHWFVFGYQFPNGTTGDSNEIDELKAECPGFEDGWLFALSGNPPFDSEEDLRDFATLKYDMVVKEK